MHFNNIALFNKTAVALTLSSLLAVPAMAQSISGRVLDQQGQPVSNAEIHIDKQQRHVFTNEQGYFSLDNVNAGITKLHVSADKFIHYNNNYTVTENDISGLEIVLTNTVMEIIDVHATPLHSSIIESALPLNVIAADELRMKQASTLGETLKNEVGVHSSYYGPVSSSPIIRGLDGPRVLVSQNGLDVGDASRVGADHVVAAETSTATQIEVLRGPATLFYGSGAIGGVVNVVDNRVPTSNDTTAEWQLQHNDVADEDEASFNINTGTENFAFHADAFWRESNDYDISGLAELETEEEHEEHEDEEDHHEESGTLANSASKSSGYTLGSSYLLDNGYIGFSYGRMDREYGIPGHSHGGHEDEHEEEHDDHEEEEHHEEGEENVFAKVKQDRFQMISDLTLSDKFLSRLATKVAYTDYQHQEIEDGAVGTTFENESLEARVDLHHQVLNGFNGAWTLHYKSSDFSADGEEAFTPPTETSSIALGWIEEKHYGDWLVQFGARIEHVTIEADGHGFGEEHHEEEHDEHEEDHDEHEDEHHDEDHEEVAFKKQTFTPVSVSVGGVWDYEPGYNIGISAAYSQRAPSGTELFANGPHIGTNTFEVGALYDLHVEGDEVHADLGDQDAELETSYNFDLTWRKFEGDFGFVISAFYNHVNDYYYQQETGLFIEAGHDHGEEHEEEDHADEHGEEEHGEEGLPVFIYQQDDVDMYGLEAEFVYQVSAPLKATIFADYIKAELSDGGNLPRIPPMRLGGQLNYQADNFAAELSVSHYFEQDQVAEFETNTDSYTMIDANVNYYLDGVGFKDMETVLFIKGQNLTDEDARVHSSFLKNVAPVPGRGISVGIRGSF